MTSSAEALSSPSTFAAMAYAGHGGPMPSPPVPLSLSTASPSTSSLTPPFSPFLHSQRGSSSVPGAPMTTPSRNLLSKRKEPWHCVGEDLAADAGAMLTSSSAAADVANRVREFEISPPVKRRRQVGGGGDGGGVGSHGPSPSPWPAWQTAAATAAMTFTGGNERSEGGGGLGPQPDMCSPSAVTNEFPAFRGAAAVLPPPTPPPPPLAAVPVTASTTGAAAAAEVGAATAPALATAAAAAADWGVSSKPMQAMAMDTVPPSEPSGMFLRETDAGPGQDLGQAMAIVPYVSGSRQQFMAAPPGAYPPLTERGGALTPWGRRLMGNPQPSSLTRVGGGGRGRGVFLEGAPADLNRIWGMMRESGIGSSFIGGAPIRIRGGPELAQALDVLGGGVSALPISTPLLEEDDESLEDGEEEEEGGEEGEKMAMQRDNFNGRSEEDGEVLFDVAMSDQ